MQTNQYTVHAQRCSAGGHTAVFTSLVDFVEDFNFERALAIARSKVGLKVRTDTASNAFMRPDYKRRDRHRGNRFREAAHRQRNWNPFTGGKPVAGSAIDHFPKNDADLVDGEARTGQNDEALGNRALTR